jgi:hypothetical protein
MMSLFVHLFLVFLEPLAMLIGVETGDITDDSNKMGVEGTLGPFLFFGFVSACVLLLLPTTDDTAMSITVPLTTTFSSVCSVNVGKDGAFLIEICDCNILGFFTTRC